jgi:hypothetical protein
LVNILGLSSSQSMTQKVSSSCIDLKESSYQLQE